MAQDNILMAQASPSLWERAKRKVMGASVAEPPPWQALGGNPLFSDAGSGSAPMENFNTFALDRFRGQREAEPYLDYFTGKKPWYFSNMDLVDWNSIQKDYRGRAKEISPDKLYEKGVRRAVQRREPTQAELALLAAQLQGIRRNPVARLGFDPERTVLLAGDNNTTQGGQYHPAQDFKYIAVDPKKNGNSLMHESIHAGLERLRKMGYKNPILDDKHDQEEAFVRLLMERYSGDSEKERRPERYSTWLKKISPVVDDRKADEKTSSEWGKYARELNALAEKIYFDTQARGLEMTPLDAR